MEYYLYVSIDTKYCVLKGLTVCSDFGLCHGLQNSFTFSFSILGYEIKRCSSVGPRGILTNVCDASRWHLKYNKIEIGIVNQLTTKL